MTIEDKLQLLDIQEVTTSRQKKNGTRIFKLPIKDLYCRDGSAIHVGSFKSGYVRRVNLRGHTSCYQLNKRIKRLVYDNTFDDGTCRKYTTRTCRLIKHEGDRLEYLIDYCLKNYYIGHANKVARSSGEYIPMYLHEAELTRQRQEEPEVKVIINGNRYNIT
tara:strand:- start:167 stop:652 length:486 start_codon:yes stop_codon:yes gene_type:complete